MTITVLGFEFRASPFKPLHKSNNNTIINRTSIPPFSTMDTDHPDGKLRMKHWTSPTFLTKWTS
jgi:hypothetical protein